MKKKNIVIIIMLMLAVALSATSQIHRGKKTSKTQPKTEQTQNGSSKQKQNKTPKKNKKQKQESKAYEVTFSCNVSTATMYIDGTESGNPNGKIVLQSGKHSVQLTAKGYEDYSTSINVSKRNTSFSFKMTPKQYLTSEETTQSVKQLTNKSNSAIIRQAITDMVYVEGGTFKMGKDAKNDDAKPTHQVTVSGFYISKYEVTQALWFAVMGNNPSHFIGSLSLPVEQVSWKDCQTFIAKLNKVTGKKFRLPTEAEWEYAARGGKSSKGYKYSGGKKLDKVAWSVDNGNNMTHTVGIKQPNELGLYDMSGNVSEWCSDWFGAYSKNEQTNPKGPSLGKNRVYRGGSWLNNSKDCYLSNRFNFNPIFSNSSIGLRLAL